MLCQSGSNHTRNQEHEARENLEETCSDSTTTGAGHHSGIILTRHLTKYTLNDVLVGTPIPETDDTCTEEYNVARILCIHRVSRVGMEHVVDAIAVVHRAGGVHHHRPTFRDATATECGQTKEEYEERTDDKNRCLDRGEGHHTLHATEYCEYCCNGNQTDGTYPEVQAQQIFEEDTTSECGHGDLRQHIGHERDDRQP